MEIGQRIKKIRQSLGISREELGEKLGLSKYAIAKYEQGQRTPDLALLLKISMVFGVTASFLIEPVFVNSTRFTNVLISKGISRSDLIKKFNLSNSDIEPFFNNSELTSGEQIILLEKISDFLQINKEYILGKSNNKNSNSDFITFHLQRILELTEDPNHVNISTLMTFIVDSMFFTIYSEALKNNIDILKVIHHLYENILQIKMVAEGKSDKNTPLKELKERHIKAIDKLIELSEYSPFED